jgi:OOP family OmpA-OmpF porin
MNKLGCFIILFVGCKVCEGQNLVPNGSFEQYTTCPTICTQLDSALFWVNPTWATPDYFNACSASSTAGVPNNLLGFQYAHSGNGYAGIILYENTVMDARDYIEVPLITSLSPGFSYHFEMYVNSANIMHYAIDTIGVYFSNTLIYGINNFLNLPFTPQIQCSSGYITDTLNWLMLSANYIATGGESYIVIGNFNNDLNTNAIISNPLFSWDAAYTYIDDVSLTRLTGIEEQNTNEEIKISPNPFADKLNITLKRNEPLEVILYDITSRKILNQTFTNSISINTGELSKGIYIYEVRNKNGVIKKGKVVKD